MRTKARTSSFIAEHVGGEVFSDGQMKAFGRTIIARAFSIGIDVDDFIATAQTPEAASQIERLNRRTVVRSHVIGVDRLDYTKGLPERFKASPCATFRLRDQRLAAKRNP